MVKRLVLVSLAAAFMLPLVLAQDESFGDKVRQSGILDFYRGFCGREVFSTLPRPSRVIHVCDDIACLANGADRLCADMERRLGRAGTPARDGQATWLRSPCLGQCERAPAVLCQVAGPQPTEWTLAPATAESAMAGRRCSGVVVPHPLNELTVLEVLTEPASQASPCCRFGVAFAALDK